MKCDKKDLILYAVTDRTWLRNMTLYERVEQALSGGATFVQLREKELDDEAFAKEAFEIKELCRRYNVPFVINDNVDIAVKVNAPVTGVLKSYLSVASATNQPSNAYPSLVGSVGTVTVPFSNTS